MTLAVVLLVMIAGGMFWYWQALPKQAHVKKSAASAAAKAPRRAPVKKSMPAKAPANSSDNHLEATRYRAVSIQCRTGACTEAQELAGKRFLSAEVPTLPLAGCDANCQCSYAHRADRRSNDDDRRNVHGLQTELYTRTGSERRKRRGRRSTDID